MKVFLCSAIVAACVAVALVNNRSVALPGKTPAAQPVSVGEFLYTVTLHKQIAPEEVTLQLNHEFIDPGMNDAIVVPLLQMIRENKLECFRAQYPFKEKLSNAEAIRAFTWTDTVQMEDPYTFDLITVPVQGGVYPEQIVSVTFHEEWFYDAATLSLRKQVKGIIPNAETSREGFAVVNPLFYVPMSAYAPDQATNELRDFTFDFHADGREHLNYTYFRPQTVVTDSAIIKRQKIFQDTLLAGLRRYAGGKKADIRVFPFPYTTAIAKEQRFSVHNDVAKSNTIRFRENWKVDMRRQVFVKEVTALMPGTEIALTEEGQTTPVAWIDDFPYLFPVNGFIPQPHRDDVISVQRISYGVNFRESDDRLYPRLTVDDPLGIVTTVNEICNKVQDGTYHAQVSLDGMSADIWRPGSIASPEEAQELFMVRDSVFVEDFEMGHWEKREFVFPAERNSGLKFFESWTYDRKANHFTKTVHGYGVNRLEAGRYNELMDVHTPFACSIPFPQPEAEIMKSEYLIATNVISPVLINANEFYPQEGEFVALKYSYYHEYYRNIYPALRYDLIQPVLADVLAGKLIAYTPDSANAPILPREFHSLLEGFENKAGSSVAGLEYRWFNELLFTEDWFFRPETGQFCKRVKEITFVHRAPDGGSEEIYGQRIFTPVFQIKLRP